MQFKRIIKWLLTFFPLILLVVYFYFKFSWLQVSSVSDMKYNAAIVEKDAALPGNFLKVWDKIYPDSRGNGMNKQLWGELAQGISNKAYNCYCDEIGYSAWNNSKLNFKVDVNKLIGHYRQFGYGLEYYTTPEKCFSFWINHDILWENEYLQDLDELSTICFGKNTTALNNAEIIQLIAYREMGDIRALRHPAEFNKEVKRLTDKFEKQ